MEKALADCFGKNQQYKQIDSNFFGKILSEIREFSFLPFSEALKPCEKQVLAKILDAKNGAALY